MATLQMATTKPCVNFCKMPPARQLYPFERSLENVPRVCALLPATAVRPRCRLWTLPKLIRSVEVSTAHTKKTLGNMAR
jgi:hypothetical protein